MLFMYRLCKRSIENTKDVEVILCPSGRHWTLSVPNGFVTMGNIALYSWEAMPLMSFVGAVKAVCASGMVIPFAS
jgi:hypothetical protein